MTDSHQFFVVKMTDGRFKVCAQDDGAILRSRVADEFQVMDVLQKELQRLKSVETIA